MSDLTDAQRSHLRSRQKFTVFALGWFLLLAGFLLIFVLKRVPLPIRIIGGLGDLVAGAVLLVLGRQMSGK